jgi:hypothetical protein
MAGILTANLVLQKTKLDNLKHVRKLNVCGVHVSDISVLRDAKNVEVLSLSVNEIQDLEPLAACTNLREVYLRRNDISDVTQVLHLSRLPFLSSLTLSDNPVSVDPNYRKFCVAALPSLVKFDDVDVSPAERADAEYSFPDLAYASPPVPLVPTPASSGAFGTPPRHSLGGARDSNYSPPAARGTISFDDGLPLHNSMRRGGAAAPAPAPARDDRLARKFQELSSQIDEMPVGGSRSSGAVSARGPRGVHQQNYVSAPAQPTSSARVASHSSAPIVGPREEGVVAAIKLLLDELTPAALLEVRRYIDATR